MQRVHLPCTAAAHVRAPIPIATPTSAASAAAGPGGSGRDCAPDDLRSSVGGLAQATARVRGWSDWSGQGEEGRTLRLTLANERSGRRARACRVISPQVPDEDERSPAGGVGGGVGGGGEWGKGRREQGTRASASTELGGIDDKSRREMMLVLAGLCLGSTASHVAGSGYTAEAGILSGSAGLQSVDPPSIDVLSDAVDSVRKVQERNRREQEDLDEQVKSSSLVKELLKRTEENREKHRREIENKYCARGAEWGVGDCAIKGRAASREEAKEEREAVLNALKREGVDIE
ncbi:hypothetical protein CBR_g50745 [Chara braunii]|uniref:Uncharacterized protein n=1 Tax=Chara braunii TaxID=69332 RepID=A0A388K5P4_CHABU|nr:hypothetical protein CBR_g50745 [Chara braunii]|eukprot:GBG65384.1 hypothetical protein CBR_g50745 [Chara braunii]